MGDNLPRTEEPCTWGRHVGPLPHINPLVTPRGGTALLGPSKLDQV